MGWAILLCVVISPDTTVSSQAVAQEVSQAEPQTLEQQGKAFYDGGRFIEAVAALQQAVQAYQMQGNSVSQAIALTNLALTYHQLGDWTQANDAINSSLNLLASLATNHTDYRLAEAEALDIRGQLQFSQGQTEAALDTWQQAAQTYKQLQDPDRLTRNQVQQSRALQALGFYQRAVMLLNELEQTLQSEPDSLTKVAELRSLGEALRRAGDLEQSEQRLQESLTIAQRLSTGSAPAKVIESIALSQLSLGSTARAQGDVSAALEWYQQAANSEQTDLQANLNRFSLLIETKEIEKAQALLPQIERRLETLPLNRATLYARINLAQSLTKSTLNYSSVDAATLLSAAVQQSEQLGDRRTQAYAIGLLGGLYEKTQQWSFAKDLTQQALQLALSNNAADITYLWQWQLGRILKAQSDQGIDSAANRIEAIAIYKEALKTLQSLRLDLASINPDQQFSFRESVEPAYRELIELLLTGTTSQENLVSARTTLESLQTVELQNFFREACLDVPIAIDRIVEQTESLSANSNLANSDAVQSRAAVIYPIILPHSIEIVLKLPNQSDLIHYSTIVDQAEVQKTLSRLRAQITQPETQRTLQLLSQQVYDWLIRPIATDLSTNQVSTLVFVLDGFLKNIPMAALYDGERYLVETYDIALTPGLELPDPQPLERQQVRLLFAGLSQSTENFSPLTAVEQEKDGILAEIPRAVVLLNQDFTAKALETQIEEAPFQIIHLATHGKFSSDRRDTFIRALDRRLNVDELRRILQTGQSRAIELLTLSACETAEGDERAALGLAGVAVRAGARSTLASLWSIDDQTSAFLMIEFYRQLVANPAISKSQALRQAQLTFVKHPNYNHPSYWAAYVLLGNWL
jgi:CHAT domain-containing protein